MHQLAPSSKATPETINKFNYRFKLLGIPKLFDNWQTEPKTDLISFCHNVALFNLNDYDMYGTDSRAM